VAREITIPPHYIRGNQSNRIPRRWIYLDTEAHDSLVGKTRTQTWRLGVTNYEHNDNPAAEWRPSEYRTHHTPADLWAYVDSRTKKRARTIVMAHNIGYDLRISCAMVELPALGYDLEQFGVSGRNVTMTWRRDTRTLIFCDSMTWWPMSLAAVGKLVGMSKLDLPGWKDSDEDWEKRCVRDVEILSEANRQCLAWIESENLGNWAKTGAGMAWANWRHQHYTHRVLVHSDDQARAAEVAAIGTGRCEAWRTGHIVNGPIVEWDLPLAYPRVASDIRVPTRLFAHVANPGLKWLARLPTYKRAIVSATVTTSVPTLPLRQGERWLWPVGTFTGWWWDTELSLASETADHIVCHEAWTYQAGLALKDWAQWIIAVIEDDTGAYSPIQRATAKHWARALIGRFGAKYPLWVEYGEAPEPGLAMGDLYDTASSTAGKWLALGEKFFVGLDESYTADACPAVMGVIMAECRVRLWRLIEAAGPENVVYMDTDSLMVNAQGDRNLKTITKEGDGWGLRVKHRYRHIEIMGPRQIIAEGEARIAGVAKTARRTASHTFEGERWEGVEQALRNGRPDVVIIRETPWQIVPVDKRGRHLADGSTEAFHVGQV
jgi:hypothetical protein